MLGGVGKAYRMGPRELWVLREIDLCVGENEYVAIMGPSGSGKTTLMNIIGCLDRPTVGSYHFAGESVEEKSDRQLAKIRNEHIGFVFQTFNLLPRTTAVANVELPMLYRGVAARKRRRRAYELLELVGLSDRAKHRPSELSGGERQRVAIARALANSPSIILADEPTGNLDSKTGEEIMEVFAELHRSGNTIIIVTHEDRIAKKAERIIKLLDGKIIAEEV